MNMKPNAIGAAVLLSISLGTPSAYADHAWADYHWAREANPFTLLVTNNLTQEWQSAFRGTVDEWAFSTVLDFAEQAGATDSKSRRNCAAADGQIAVCNQKYGRNGWLGLATINIDSNSHITSGSARMNDSYASYWASMPDERNHVVCQEIGHLLGLGHPSEDGSSQGTCMDYSTAETSQWPNEHDFDELLEIYAHLDAYSSVSDTAADIPAPRRGHAKAGVPAAVPMGILVKRTSRHEIWVASDGVGGYWIHDVLLVPEAYRAP